ncbi:MAG: cytochrome b/b6 domain-containing protein [Acetobacteraceae bacterium]|nr:cytochrome b/b6 domain-containing protein [Acetobacteraceae bacterium]
MTGERILRHQLTDRLYHWVMAAAALVCLFTAFLPILGWKFEWVTAHWIAGVVLSAAVVFHIVRAVFWQDFWAMVIGWRDVRSSWRMAMRALGRSGPPAQLPAKYSPLQKIYHKVVAAVVLALIATGLLMLAKIDTRFWRRNPYWLADSQWGIIYAIHGLCAMAMITLIITHIYFALRSEKLWMTRSMFRGWISHEDYVQHHDPARWPVPARKEDEPALTAPIRHGPA